MRNFIRTTATLSVPATLSIREYPCVLEPVVAKVLRNGDTRGEQNHQSGKKDI